MNLVMGEERKQMISKALETKARVNAMRPAKPANRLPVDEWPFQQFEDDPRAERIKTRERVVLVPVYLTRIRLAA